MKVLWTKSDDGTKIRVGRWNDEGEKNLMLVHGFAEHLGRYEHIAQFFAEKGWRVTAVEFRGHGESEGKRGHTHSWMKYCEDLRAAMGTVGAPMVMVSHSMGGLVTFWSMMHSLAPPVKAFAISNPLLGLFEQPSPITVLVGKLVSKIAPKMNLPAGEVNSSWLSHDPEVEKAYLADPLVYNAFTARWAASMLQAIDEVHAYAPKYTHSVRLMLGGDDRICDPDAGRKFASNFGTQGGGTLELVEYPKCYHELFNEVEKYEILEATNEWLETEWSKE
jgi:alpha-beta hydrolase superfamily lysophospholipase